MAKAYKGYSRAQLIDILADFAVHTATVSNCHAGSSAKNTNKADYVGLYSSYPMTSKKYPAFSLAGLFEAMNDEIARAAEIATFVVPAAERKRATMFERGREFWFVHPEMHDGQVERLVIDEVFPGEPGNKYIRCLQDGDEGFHFVWESFFGKTCFFAKLDAETKAREQMYFQH